MENPGDIDFSARTRRSVVVVLALIALGSTAALYLASVSHFRSSEIGGAQNRLSIFSRSLNDALERFQHLPFVLARDELIRAAHTAESQDQLNDRLASFAKEAGLEAIYYMDASGLVLAASNYGAPVTFVGNNYGFRPYFRHAMEGERGEFFGIGATTGRPGYFVSEPVRDASGTVVGVVAIKLDMSELQSAWEQGGEKVFVSNRDGIIVLASDPTWLYRALDPLDEAKKEAILDGRQFGNETLKPFDWVRAGDLEAAVAGQQFVYVSGPAERLGWTVHYLLSEDRIYERAVLATFVLGIALLALLIVATYLRSRRIRSALLVSQEDRRRLQLANAELAVAHEELARTSKLVALGQLSASVTHELGQPLSAMRNYIVAAEMADPSGGLQVIAKLKTVLERMEHVTSQLKFFAKPADQTFTTVSLQGVYSGAMDMIAHDVAARGVRIDDHVAPVPVNIHGDQLRLEQVTVNLLKNGLNALETSDEKTLSVSIRKINGHGLISIEDTGCGLGGRDLSQLQEPFHTTRASGDGMGLGLSIAAAIIREHNGRLTAHDTENGGACFTVEIPLADAGA